MSGIDALFAASYALRNQRSGFEIRLGVVARVERISNP